MEPSERGSYFVRLKNRPPAGWSQPDPATDERPRRRSRRFTIRPLPVLLAIVLAWCGWAATTEGGVSARANDVVDGIRDMISDATTDPALKRAATYYNDVYARTGSYPRLGAEDASAAGVGVDVEWCNTGAIVLQGFSGSGTKSRLLLAGRDLGDVAGAVRCPASFNPPAPWSLPDS